MGEEKKITGLKASVIKGRRPKWLTWVIIIVLLAGALLLVADHFRGPKNPHRVDLASLTPQEEAQYLGDAGDYKAAERVWDKQLAKAKDTPTKLGIYYQQSALAIRTKHYKDAKKYAEKAVALDKNSNIPYVALAELAQAQGDKTAAKQNWQLAIAHLDPNTPGANLILRDYKASLGGVK